MYQVSVSARYQPFSAYKVSVSDRLVKTGIGASLKIPFGDIGKIDTTKFSWLAVWP